MSRIIELKSKMIVMNMNLALNKSMFFGVWILTNQLGSLKKATILHLKATIIAQLELKINVGVKLLRNILNSVWMQD